MASILVDTAKFPIVHVRFPSELTTAEIDEHFAEMSGVNGRGKFAVVIDINALGAFGYGPATRRYLAKKADVLAAEGSLQAEAVYTSNAVTRGLFTAYSWLRSNKKAPAKCFETREQAEAWAGSCVR